MSKQSITKNTYNKIANEYANLNNNNQELVPIYSKFKEFLPNGKIYDLGCGTGRDTNALQNLGFDVVGLDYSEGMLKVAKDNFPNCKFKQTDMLLDLKLMEKVDGIWACASLLHFNEEQFMQVMKSIINLINENGILYISLKLSDTLDEETVNGRYFKYYTAEKLNTIFRQLNLKVLHHTVNGSEERKTFGNYILKKF